MTDRPMNFSAPMVRALLAGRKSQTRTILKPQPAMNVVTGLWHCRLPGTGCSVIGVRTEDVPQEALNWIVQIEPGDRIWVREAFTDSEKHLVAYRADGECGSWSWDGDGKPVFIRHGAVMEAAPGGNGNFGFSRYGGRWRPSIHMPRWASRLTLVVTDVRVDRVQAISEADAVAEGIARSHVQQGTWIDYPERTSAAGWKDPRESFRTIWNTIHGPGAWERNEFIVALTFETHRCNIDSMPASAGD